MYRELAQLVLYSDLGGDAILVRLAEIFRDLRKRLGEPYFSMLFQVIVTDRGSEFTDPMKIEADPETGKSSAGYFTAIP